MRKLLARRTLIAAGVSTLAGIAFVRTAKAAQFSWKYASVNTPNDPSNVASVRAFARIRAETNGAMEITPFFNGSLGDSVATVTQLRLGAIEMSTQNGGTLDTLIPVASIEGVAYAFPDRKAIFNAMDGDLGRVIRNEFASHGFVATERVFENGFRHLTTSTKAIRRADDMQGLKFRIAVGKLYTDTFRTLGVETLSMDLPQVYVGLQTHLADGQEAPLPTIEDLRLYEVQKYCSLSHHMWAGKWMLINQAKFESLPRNFQEIVRRNVNAAALAERDANEAMQQSLRDKLTSQGMTVNEVDAGTFKAKLVAGGYYGRWRKEYGPTAWAALEKYAGPLS